MFQELSELHAFVQLIAGIGIGLLIGSLIGVGLTRFRSPSPSINLKQLRERFINSPHIVFSAIGELPPSYSQPILARLHNGYDTDFVFTVETQLPDSEDEAYLSTLKVIQFKDGDYHSTSFTPEDFRFSVSFECM